MKTPEHLNYLDGWRGLAIALVLESHFVGLLPVASGRLGVDVFFSLSGFLMSGLLFIQRQSLVTFYKRRVSRIMPAFFAFVITVYLFAICYAIPVTTTEFISTALFLRTYFPAYPGMWGSGIPIGHIWSLNVEEHCYVFMSLLILLRLFRGREGFVLLAVGTLSVCLGIVYVKLGTNAPRWGELGTEVAASHLLVAAGYRLIRVRWHFRVSPSAPLFALALGMACYAKGMPWWSSILFSPYLLAFSINHLTETFGGFKALLAAPAFRYLGIWSFSIYLWQQPFYSYKTSYPGGTSAAFATAFIISLASYYILERPSRAWLNKHW